jgi:hypothetical protein
LAHTARDVWQNTMRPLGATDDWGTRPVERFDTQLPDLRLRGNRSGLTLPIRTPELLNYMLRCPSVRFSGFLLEKKSVVKGHFLLADHGEQIRLADLVVDSAVVEDWVACYALACSTAKRSYPHGGHLVAMTAPAPVQSALLRAGFHEKGRINLISQDWRSVLVSSHIPAVNMMDSDAAYLL